ncbi:MAG: SCP2 sterol-binding domain-containing protein [Microscillaceae bacterium]|nr:SCP2 sterol-binding domain-containing protein [Microscillaceae bacterium]
MDLASVTQKVAEKAANASENLGSSVKFDLRENGVVYLNGSNNEVSNENNDADCTVSMDLEDFNAMLDGEINPMSAFMGGKMQIDGDMSVAMKMSSLFS